MYFESKEINVVGVCCHQDPEEYRRKYANNFANEDQYRHLNLPDAPNNQCGDGVHQENILRFENDEALQLFRRLNIEQLQANGLERYASYLN